jgi:class 3 adenylate cyclase
LHTWHSITVTLNERLDYFGQTVNITSRVQQLAEINDEFASGSHPIEQRLI